MALRATVVFLGLHLVDTDLLALSGLDDLAGHGGAFHNGGAEHVDKPFSAWYSIRAALKG